MKELFGEVEFAHALTTSAQQKELFLLAGL